jgi:hypothetical protein
MKKKLQKIKKVISKFGLLSIFIALNIKGNAQTTTVVYSGAITSYTVPAGVTSISIEGRGGQGKSAQVGYIGGLGAKMKGDFTVTPGTVLLIAVGGQGQLSGTENGGGGGGTFIVKIDALSSDIMATAPYIGTKVTPLIVAGGGGGCRNITSQNGNPGVTTTYATNASGAGVTGGGITKATELGIGGIISSSSWGSAGAGFRGNGANDGTYGTGGASFLNGAVGGLGSCSSGTGINGGFGGGGSGGGCNGGGGGGGYSGGDGGRVAGGGGSWNTGINQLNAAGFQSGDGIAIITVLSGLSITQTSTIACNGLLTAALSATVSGVTGPFTYSWSPSGGTASTATGLGAGTYTCVATSSTGTISGVFTVTQPAILVSTVASQTNVSCNAGANGAITLTTTGGTAPYSYTWSPTGGSSATASGLVANTYSCIVKDVNLCTATTSPSATITQPASFSISASASNSVICGSGSTTLTASGAATYTWTGGVVNGASFSPTVTNTYSATATNSLGCAASNTAVVTVNVGTTPTVTVNSGVICAGSSFTMVPTGASSYTSSSGSAVVSPTTNTSYTVTGASVAGCTNTAVSSITVNASPSVVASTSNSVICVGNSVVLTASTSATSYTWNTGATTMTVSVSPTVTSTYTVSVSNAAACVASSTVLVTVNPCTGINEILANSISVYPNPNNGILNINLTSELAQNSSLEVYDALGKLVVKQVLANELNTINISNLNNGIYTFKVLNSSNNLKVGKLIKQ